MNYIFFLAVYVWQTSSIKLLEMTFTRVFFWPRCVDIPHIHMSTRPEHSPTLIMIILSARQFYDNHLL